MTTYGTCHIVVSGLGFPESVRWHDRALWFADWAAGTVFRVGRDLEPRPVAHGAGFPLCFDLLPTTRGPRPLLVSNSDRAVLLVDTPDGEPSVYGSLAGLGDHPWNEIVLAADGSAYVNNIGFAFGEVDGSDAGPVGFITLVHTDGSTELVADGLAFPNGMALTDDGRTLLVAESWGSRLTGYTVAEDGRLTDRRVWAETPGLHPDGIDAHDDGTVSLADVGTRSCVRIAKGGEVLDRVELPQPAFDCVVGDLGSGPTLYVAVNAFGQDSDDRDAGAAGKILAVPLS